MKLIGLTGGIASGKSAVARMLAAAGVAVVDADVLAREAVAPGSAPLQGIVTRFGAGVLLPDGSLDRKKLGGVVFGDDAARRVWPGAHVWLVGSSRSSSYHTRASAS